MFQVGTPHPVRREVSRTFSDPESRSRRSSSRSDATSAQPSRCRHHPLTRESRRGVAQVREREREISRALSGSANPTPPHHPQRKYLSDYIGTIHFIAALSIVLHREHRKKTNVGCFKLKRGTYTELLDECGLHIYISDPVYNTSCYTRTDHTC